MNEMMSMGSSEEEKNRLEEEAQIRLGEEMAEAFLAKYPELIVLPENTSESAIAEFEEMIDSFEATHSLEQLHAIIDLTPEEAPFHPIREPARQALAPIVAKLNGLKDPDKILKQNINASRKLSVSSITVRLIILDNINS